VPVLGFIKVASFTTVTPLSELILDLSMLHHRGYTIGTKRDKALQGAKKCFWFNVALVILVYLIHYTIRYGQEI